MKLAVILLLVGLYSSVTVNGSAASCAVKEMKVDTIAEGKGAFVLAEIKGSVVNLDDVQVVANGIITFNCGHGYDHFDMDTVDWINVALNYSNDWDADHCINWKNKFVGGPDHYPNIKYCKCYRSTHSIDLHKLE